MEPTSSPPEWFLKFEAERETLPRQEKEIQRREEEKKEIRERQEEEEKEIQRRREEEEKEIQREEREIRRRQGGVFTNTDSSPGAIKLLSCKNGSDKNDQLSLEDDQALMKRYLQCPGMCRVDVLKKFVRNKYNVDTSLFHIDILYKRVPLPDHYTLIDIAYIYSWKRNEPMKFFFRITDINKVSERFDYFDSKNSEELIVHLPLRSSRNNSSAANRRKEHVAKKRSKQESQNQANGCDKKKNEIVDKKVLSSGDASDTCTNTKTECDSDTKLKVDQQKLNSNKENVKVKVLETSKTDVSDSTEQSPKRFILKIKKDPEKDNSLKTESKSPSFKIRVTSTVDSNDSKISVTSSSIAKPDVSGHLKNNVRNQQSDVKNSVYTNITLNRTNNLEIITKIQKVSSRDGQPLGLNILEQTVKANEQKRNKKAQNKKSLLKYKPNIPKIQVFSKDNNDVKTESVSPNKIDAKNKSNPEVKTDTGVNPTSTTSDNDNNTTSENLDKIKFLNTFQLAAKNSIPEVESKVVVAQKSPNVDKRKPSPSKSVSPKKVKLDKKPVTRIILQTKPKPVDKLQPVGLQSLIENCKIPSSLSITIKDGTENNNKTSLIPPVKNYIEILKLPEENKQNVNKDNNSECKLNFSLRMNDDSEQKVDEDLAEIAKSLTEKIPMSTTISQIVGPKPEFTIPIKTNVPPKFNLQPSPVPDISNKLLTVPKENKLNPRSPQSFQKIFEESIKKPDDSAASDPAEKDAQKPVAESNSEVSSTSSNKRNILEIATQLYKRTKLELDKNQSQNQIDSTTPKAVPKIAIPRLPNQRNLKKTGFDNMEQLKSQQTLTNLHSNALGLNYTISVGPNVAPKTNGIVTKKETEVKASNIPVKSPMVVEAKPNAFLFPKDLPGSSPRPNSLPRNLSPGIYNSPRNSPKHSPKSSPMIKHMYAPMPNLMMDQLRVNTYSPKLPSPKINNFSKSPNLPSSSTNSHSPNTSSSASPKAPASKPSDTPTGLAQPLSVTPPHSQIASKGSPKPSSSNQSSPLSPNQILERYNIQNLAQLTANLNFNAANFNSGSQLTPFQQAMILKHFEIQNRQLWQSMNLNQGSLLQYEKYLQNLQNLKSAQSQLLSNIKEN